jgi:hypothetical protein
MTDLVTRLRRTYHAEIQIEPQLVKEAADRIASLELALVELSQTSVSPSDVANATVLASRVRTGLRAKGRGNRPTTRSTKRLSGRPQYDPN